MTQAEATAPPAGATKKPKKKRLLLFVMVAVLTLGSVGGVGGYFYTHRNRAPAVPPPADPGIAALDPFVVNLADAGGQRFVRLTLRLVLETKHAAEELKEDELGRMRARSSILELLSLQTADRLVTPEGKAELKKSIAERATHALGHTKVVDVLFTEFVVQF
jgi:flagellar protein FliL